MKIFYGYDDQHYVNVTSTIFNQCMKGSQLVIPTGDYERCQIVGFDPYPGVLKHILVVDYTGGRYRFEHGRVCSLSFESVLQQLRETGPKTWWNQTGKHIADETARLEGLHQHLTCDHGSLKEEYPEQIMVLRYVKEDAKVLEIGGNIGRNSLVLSTILANTDQLVVLESHPAIVPQLVHNLHQNGFDTRVGASALSYTPLIQNGWDTIPLSDAKEEHAGWKTVPVVTFEELQSKYAIQFDTIVADCEGALYYLFKDHPEVLDNIHTIIMENDYKDIDHKTMVNAILGLKGFSRIYHEAGGWGPCQEFFFEVWQKAA